MATRTTSYRITGDASQFASAMQDAAGAADQMEGALGSLKSNIEAATQGAIEFDEAVERYRDASGQFVSGADAQKAALSELRDEGIRTEEQIQEQIERLEALREVKGDDAVATQELTERISSLRSELQQAEAAVQESEAAARQLQMGFSSGVVATTDFARRQDILQQELRQTAAAEERVTNAGVTMRSSVGASANNLAFEMTQAAQDMQFGLAGVANQIPLMSEQFTQLQAKAGSTMGAVKSLASTFLGPTGLLAAGTLLIQMGPQIADFFTSTAQSAREATDAYQSAAEEIFALEEVDLPGIDGVRELRRRQDLFEEAVASIEQQRREITAAQFGPAGRLTGGETRLLSRLESRGDRYQAILNKINEQLRQRRTEMQAILDVQGDLLRQVDVVEPENQIIEFDMPDLDASVEDLLSSATGLHARLEEANESAEDLYESVRDIGELTVFGDTATEIENAVFVQERFNEALQNMINRMETAARRRRQMRAFGIPEQAAQARDMPARGPAASGQLGTTLDEALRRDIEEGSRRMTRDFSDVQDQVENTDQQIAQMIQTIGQMGSALAQAFQQGEVSAQQMVATALSGIGAILSATGLPIAGAGLGAVSNVVGSFQHGGLVDTPLQIVGEEGPELAALPQGSRVFSNRQSREMMRGSRSVNVQIETQVRRLPGGDIALVAREAQGRREQFGYDDPA